ncbi:MAG: vitamin B12 transporter [Paraglaciecola sp.]|jgi:outer membrane cobalamin receptor
MKNIITLLFSFLTLPIFAQTTITGVVIGQKKEAIIGANIFLKDTYDGTSSEIDGSFTFKTEETGEQIILITYIGYEEFSKTVNLTNENINLEISLIEEANELNTVTISAGSFEASDEKKAVMLTSLDIVTTAGATADIAGALNTLPGTQRVGETGELFVRGGAAYETKTFIDGLYVPKPYSSTTPDVPSRGRFSPFLFKGTMFSTGGYSAEYGQALSSALILESNDLAPETVTGVSLMTLGLGGSHTQRWDKTSLSGTVNYTNLAPYLGLTNQDLDWVQAPQSASGQMIFRHKTSETGIFKTHADVSKSWFKLKYPDLNDFDKKTTLSLNNDNTYVNSSFREILNDKWSFFAGLSYGYDADEISDDFSLKTQEHTGVAKMTLTNYLTEDMTIKFGTEYLKTGLREDYTAPDSTVFTTNLKENLASTFAETSIYLSRKFVARVGLRFEHSTILNQKNLAPRLSLAYKVSDHGQFSFAYGDFYQTPINEQLRYNNKVEFEKAHHFMLNYQLIKDTRTFRVEGYYKKYDNLVKYNTETPWLSNNSGDGYARGLDVFYRDQGGLLKKADFWISYSFLDTKRDWRAYPTESTPRFASKHNLSVVYKRWFPKITSSLGLTYSYGSPRPYNNPNTDGFNDERTPAYQDLSMNFTHLTSIGGHFTVLHLSINNLAGFDNTFGYRYSDTPDDNGQFQSVATKPAIKQFMMVGCFISIGQKYAKDNGVTSD